MKYKRMVGSGNITMKKMRKKKVNRLMLVILNCTIINYYKVGQITVWIKRLTD